MQPSVASLRLTNGALINQQFCPDKPAIALTNMLRSVADLSRHHSLSPHSSLQI
ncbi:hypothetical protein [Trichocoleus desertorum]|uniref:hypothetical protein n=1 Tax=Trichocoleus desertorum TaxID=1481672 RepID=UPI003298A52F